MELKVRPRRLRTTEAMRKMVRETRVDKSSLIYPIFAIDGTGIKEEIPSMPGQYRYSVDQLPYALEEAANLGVNNILMFGIPEHKDECGSQAYAHDGIVQRALREGKKEFPDMLYIADVCMCEYTSHGHCGILDGEYVDNDKTLKMLAQIASSQAEAGADIVAPSDMMDGHVAAIREKLDEDGFINTPIMSYAVKFASAFYGPFRDAADSAPHFGDRKSYQMDYHNGREAMKEALLDVEEGTDFLIVKPAMAFYDLLERVVSATNIPVATYSVSGEYSMVKAAAQNGWIDEERIISEMAIGAFRAGAGMYITYFAKELAKLIDEGKIG
ncbi:MAG: porphobilinogen synthase [Clostridia bacterium]|nr:porphobilinogen synthase [Clostridia bacterium]